MLTRGLLGQAIASPNGCPTMLGLLLHTLVFLLVTWGMMNIKREKYYYDKEGRKHYYPGEKQQ
jgi:hypothetical protein